MIRRRWPFVSDLLDELREDNNGLRHDYTSTFYNLISNSFHSELDRSKRIAAQSAANIFEDILFNSVNVATPEDISVNNGQTTVDSGYDETYEIENNVLWLLYSAGLERIEGKYVVKGKYSDYEYLLVAPIPPNVDEITTALGDPVAVSDTTIHHLVLRAFTDQEHLREADYADRAPEVSTNELEAFIGLIRSELDEGKWIRIEDLDEGEIWVNPDQVKQMLEEYAPKIPESEFRQMLLKKLVNSTPSIDESTTILVDGYIYEVLRKLKIEYGSERITIDDTTWVYTSSELYQAELAIYGEPHVETANNLQDANKPEIQEAFLFHEQNEETIKELYTDPDRLPMLMKKMESRLVADAQLGVINQATPGEPDVDSTMSVSPDNRPSKYGVLRDFEKQLEEDVEEDEGDDSESGHRVI